MSYIGWVVNEFLPLVSEGADQKRLIARVLCRSLPPLAEGTGQDLAALSQPGGKSVRSSCFSLCRA